MKNTKLKSSAILLSIVIGSTPVLGCTTVPRANTSRGDFAIEVASAATTEAKPAPATGAQGADKAEAKKEEEKPAAKPAEKKAKADKAEAKKEEEKPVDAAFTIDNFQVIQKTLEKLGIPPEELEKQVKEGKKLVQVLEEGDISVKKFKKQLYKEYCAAIKEGVKSDKLTKDEGKVLKKAIKEKVDAWMSEEK